MLGWWRRTAGLGIALAISGCASQSRPALESAPAALAVDVRVDAARSLGTLARPWRYFGADEPNYTTTPHGRKLLGELGALAPGEVFFRAHNLLTSGDGTPSLKWGSTNAYTERNGVPTYDWTVVDGIFDVILAANVKPLVEIGFMPEAMSTNPASYRHHWPESFFTGWTYPPKDYEAWEELVYRWAKHCVDKYGQREVQTWWWETWNEPNIGYFSGTPEEFFRLNDHAIAGVRRALPSARVGGPHTAGDGGEFMDRFLDHALNGQNHATGERGTPLDYLAFHAKGKPEMVDGRIRMGIQAQLATIETAFTRFSRLPELAGKPVIIGESDPEGCAACTGEGFDYRNGTIYASYTAASVPRVVELAERHDINLEGAVTWAFTFDRQPYFAGFRQLASNGLPLAVLNVFRMFSKLGHERVAAESSGAQSLDQILQHGVRAEPDVGVLASRTDRTVTILLWHYHDDDAPAPARRVVLTVSGLAPAASRAELTHYRVDTEHGDVYSAWRRIGSPAAPSAEQYAALERASQLAPLQVSPEVISVSGGSASLDLTLPRHAVSLVVLEPIER